MTHQPGHWMSTAVSFAIVAAILALRLRHVGRERPLTLERLWIVPAVYGAIALVAFWFLPSHGITWLWCALAVAAGVVLGWYRGTLVAIRVDPDTHVLNQTTSPAAMAFIIAIVAIRLGARTLAVEMEVGNSILVAITDVLIAFALGFLPVQRLEMGLRAARLLREVRGQ